MREISPHSDENVGMLDELVIIEPRDAPARELAAAFAAVLPAAARILRLDALDALREHEDDETGEPLVVVHEAAGDGSRVGLDLIAALRARRPDAAIVLASQRGGSELEQRAVNAGATDLLVLGPRLADRVETLVTKLTRLFEIIARNRQLDEQNERLHRSIQQRSRIAGESPQIRRLIAQIERVARIPRPLLITGERGTGKELVARAIHFASDRRAGSIVTVNCAALGESLLESELFGHEKGAFTGADRARRGKFEQADDGTLFLDEIGNMPLSFQQKILRVVEYGTFTRVGGSTERKTSARIVAATNADLRERIDSGEFLGDLYDRLAFEVIDVPPLRERPGDIEILGRIFLDLFADEIPAFRGKRLSEAAVEQLRDYPFPGNVRELKNLIERAAYRDTTHEMTPEDIGLLGPAAPRPSGAVDFKSQVEGFSRQLIERALEASGGNQAAAARSLGLTYDQFRHYRRKYLASR
jgi:DNA-binding NtrC family response regulator